MAKKKKGRKKKSAPKLSFEDAKLIHGGRKARARMIDESLDAPQDKTIRWKKKKNRLDYPNVDSASSQKPSILKTRKFDGNDYEYHNHTKNKRKADSLAEKLRKGGIFARVFFSKANGHYQVYTREKSYTERGKEAISMFKKAVGLKQQEVFYDMRRGGRTDRGERWVNGGGFSKDKGYWVEVTDDGIRAEFIPINKIKEKFASGEYKKMTPAEKRKKTIEDEKWKRKLEEMKKRYGI